MLDILRSRPCVDCGEADPVVLEFDHVGPKDRAVAVLVSTGVRVDLIEQEIARCDVVCCNCHRCRTYRRRGTTRTIEAAQRIADWRVRRNLEWVYNVLGYSACVDCGIQDPLVLEFDHVGLKRRNVMSLAWEGYGMDTIQIEMNKCEIRCANCHRRRTAQAGNHYRHAATNEGDAPAKLEPGGPLA